MQRILHLAGLPLDREPQHLHFSHLRAIAEPEIRRAIIRYAIYHTPDVGLVIIDGIRDLMHDINSSIEATKLVGDLMRPLHGTGGDIGLSSLLYILMFSMFINKIAV